MLFPGNAGGVTIWPTPVHSLKVVDVYKLDIDRVIHRLCMYMSTQSSILLPYSMIW